MSSQMAALRLAYVRYFLQESYNQREDASGCFGLTEHIIVIDSTSVKGTINDSRIVSAETVFVCWKPTAKMGNSIALHNQSKNMLSHKRSIHRRCHPSTDIRLSL